MRLFVLLVFVSLFLSGCLGNDKSLCQPEPGYVRCGYCSEDAALSDNPNAGQCRYCPTGSECRGDVCGELKCVKPGSRSNYDNDNYNPPDQKQYYASCSSCDGPYRTYSYRGYSYETCNAYYQVCVESSCDKILDNCR